mgnify:CR=1 FL=1
MLGLLFLTIKSNNRRANIFLGLFLWSLSVEVAGSLMSALSEEDFTESTFEVFQSSLFTIPFLLLYVSQTINTKFKNCYFLLFLPGVLINLVSSLFPEPESWPDFSPVIEYIFNIGLLLYILKLLNNHKLEVRDFYSDLENKTLSWIKNIVYIFLYFHVLWILEDIISFQNEEWASPFAAVSVILTFFMVYWIGYNGFSQAEIFKSKLFVATENATEDSTVFNQTPSTQEFGQFKDIKNQIISEKLFTDVNLNLRSLAEKLQMNEKQLSKLINQQTKSNFYHFINGYRISEFKELLKSPKAQQLSILGLAQEAGFSSKSTFYTAFKTIEGTTPKQYELSLKASE